MEMTLEQVAVELKTTVETVQALRRKAARKANRDLGLNLTADDIQGPFPASVAPVPGRCGMMMRLSPLKGQWCWAQKDSGPGWRGYASGLGRAQQKASRRQSRKALVWCGMTARTPA
jgi:hypothetical protein